MDDALFRKMLGAITGFAITVEDVRETVKLAQHKSAADRAGTVAGPARGGRDGAGAGDGGRMNER